MSPWPCRSRTYRCLPRRRRAHTFMGSAGRGGGKEDGEKQERRSKASPHSTPELPLRGVGGAAQGGQLGVQGAGVGLGPAAAGQGGVADDLLAAALALAQHLH